MHLIIETKTKQVKNPNTKTTYITESVTKSILTEREYGLTTNDDTLSWFRRLGGTETAQKSYTSYGYTCYRLASTSPDRQNKTIREFQFVCLDYREGETFKKLFKSYDNGLFYLKRFKAGKTLKQIKEILKAKTVA